MVVFEKIIMSTIICRSYRTLTVASSGLPLVALLGIGWWNFHELAARQGNVVFSSVTKSGFVSYYSILYTAPWSSILDGASRGRTAEQNKFKCHTLSREQQQSAQRDRLEFD